MEIALFLLDSFVRLAAALARGLPFARRRTGCVLWNDELSRKYENSIVRLPRTKSLN